MLAVSGKDLQKFCYVLYKRHPSRWLRRHSDIAYLPPTVRISAMVDFVKSDFFNSKVKPVVKRDNFYWQNSIHWRAMLRTRGQLPTEFLVKAWFTYSRNMPATAAGTCTAGCLRRDVHKYILLPVTMPVVKHSLLNLLCCCCFLLFSRGKPKHCRNMASALTGNFC